jgi:hypothetical protein
VNFKFLDRVRCTDSFHSDTVGTVLAKCSNLYRIRFHIVLPGNITSFYDDTIDECFLEKA